MSPPKQSIIPVKTHGFLGGPDLQWPPCVLHPSAALKHLQSPGTGRQEGERVDQGSCVSGVWGSSGAEGDLEEDLLPPIASIGLSYFNKKLKHPLRY